MPPHPAGLLWHFLKHELSGAPTLTRLSSYGAQLSSTLSSAGITGLCPHAWLLQGCWHCWHLTPHTRAHTAHPGLASPAFEHVLVGGGPVSLTRTLIREMLSP